MKIFDTIPTEIPNNQILNKITYPEDLKKLSIKELEILCDEIREFLIYSVYKTSGHFSSNLGTIELTIALHYVFNAPYDKLIWDVGHQAYVHKILTGRKDRFHSLRKTNGLIPFPSRSESVYDAFGVGHSSTSISATLGMAIAAKLKNENNKHIAIIGDGAFTAGMAFEALNHSVDTNVNMLIVLNDNEMSISKNVGALSRYLTKLITSNSYNKLRLKTKKITENYTLINKILKKTEEYFKSFLYTKTFFDRLGVNYLGVVDGHSLNDLIATFKKIKNLKGISLLHVKTIKGKGFKQAEKNQIKYHFVNNSLPQNNIDSYSDIFGKWIVDAAKKDQKIVAITPAMKEGSRLEEFAKMFPDRFFDVAISEQHALTLAAGISCSGLKPIVAIYSTFLQRAYDQFIHDIALQGLDILIAIDRAGLVGPDGPTHAGIFDIAFLNAIPDIIFTAPSCEKEMYLLLDVCYRHKGTSCIRYPKKDADILEGNLNQNVLNIGIGKSNKILEGKDIAILSFGTVLKSVITVGLNLNATVIDMRFIKPLDLKEIERAGKTHKLIVTIEDGSIISGIGVEVNRALQNLNIQIHTLNLGFDDSWTLHGDYKELQELYGMNSESIEKNILNKWNIINK